MSASLVTDASDVIRDSVRDWNQYTLTGGSGAVLVTTVMWNGAGAGVVIFVSSPSNNEMANARDGCFRAVDPA